MKKFFFLLSALMLTARFAHAQTEALDAFVDRHKNDQRFMFAYLSKELFEVVSKTDLERRNWEKLHHVVKNLGSLRILAADSMIDGKGLYREALNLVPETEFDPLLTVRDGDENVRIWVKESDNIVSDLILLVGAPQEFVLIRFGGSLELGNLSELADLFDTKDVKRLVRATNRVVADFTLSPNPGNGDITLSYRDADDYPVSATLTDPQGRVIRTLRLSGSPTESVKLGPLPSGLYWLQLKTQNGKVGLKQVQIVRTE
jgi:Domain of unknown function (DUF4252)/Secretion system C-terminal sorting domain